MTDVTLLPEDTRPRKPFWRPWKWIGLICFALVLLLKSWLHDLTVSGTVLGLFPKVSYQASSVQLDPGTLLAIFTDGVTEAVNSADEEFGEERLLRALRDCQSRSPEGIYRYVTDQVREWQGAQKQHDDITLIIAKVS